MVRGYLGVVIQPVTDDLAQQLHLPDSRGALVDQLTPGSPAENAGLKRGDVIRKFNGHLISDTRELQRRVAEVPVDEEAKLAVIRGGKEIELTAKIAEQPTDLLTQQAPAGVLPYRGPPAAPSPGGETGNVLRGITVSEIPDDHRHSLPENVHGVMITGIEPDSPAAGSLQAGDVIEEISHQPIRSVDDYNKLVGALKSGEKQLLIIARGRVRSFVVLTP